MNKIYLLRVIKLTAFLYFFAFLQLSYASYSQSITYTSKQESLEKVLQVVKNQTQYEVLGTKNLLQGSLPITVKANKMPLETFLKMVFDKQPVGYKIVDRTIVLVKNRTIDNSVPTATSEVEIQQAIQIKVLGKDKIALSGATISSNQVDIGIVDQEGKFILQEMPKNKTIEIKMLGYNTMVYKLKEGVFDYEIQMIEQSKEVDEVIITGYQTLNKNSFTGTAVTKTGEELRQVNPQNLLQAVQVFDPSFRLMDNNLSGSDPNKLPNITVRGTSALPSGNNEVLRRDNINSITNMPAFILDGYEVSVAKVLDLDMTRIESVTLLKDAAATAIYGSRAANGVMVITTKAPKEGELRLTYNHETNIAAPDLSDYKLLNAAEKLEYEKLAGLYDTDVQRISQDQLDEWYYQKYANVIGGVDTYWLSQPVRTAIGQKHALYLEGGAQSFRYGVDLRYQTRPGVMKGSARNQYSGGVNLNYNLNNKLRFQNELAITMVNGSESPFGSFDSYAKMNPYYRMKDENGNIIQEADIWTRVANSGASSYESILNPAYNATLSNFDKEKYTEIMNNFSGDFDLGYGLRLRGQLSFLKTYSLFDAFLSPKSNEFFYYPTNRTDEKGSYTNEQNNSLNLDGNIRLNWVKSIDKHQFNVVTGANIRSEEYDYKSFTAFGFANDRFSSIGFAKGYGENAKPYSYKSETRLIGTFLSANYAYDNKYLLDLTVRADGSSKFGSNNRVAPFWSTGIGWNVHEESWFNKEIISLLRLRATTGMVGSVQFSPYMSRTTYSYDQENWYSSGIGTVVNNYGNDDLSWQKSRTIDAGFDIGLWNDRVFLTSRYYHKLTKDILADINLAPSTGFVNYKANLGDMENKGIEINLNVIPVKSDDWTFSIMINLARNENKIVKISNALKSYNDRVNEAQNEDDLKGVPLLRYKEGQSIDAIYAVPSLGIDPENGREIYLNMKGEQTYDWNANDITVVAVATPKLEGSIGATIRYKQFTAVAYFQIRVGGKMYNQTLVDRVENADPRFNVDSRVLEEKWKQPGDQTFYKSIQDLGQTRVSSRFIMDDNIFSMNSLFLSYEAKKEFAKKMSLSNLRLGLTTNDLLRWSSIKQERGIFYPYARTVNFTLQAAF